MAKKRRGGAAARDRPAGEVRSVEFVDSWNDSLACSGYTRLSNSPEISAAVDRIAGLVALMTVHKMRNAGSGDERVFDRVSRLVDVTPNRVMNRAQFIRWLVRTLILDGDGNAVVLPVTQGGELTELLPVPAAYVSLTPRGVWDYSISIGGRQYAPDSLLHFVLNPGTFYPWWGEGYRVTLRDVAHNLKQAAATERGFMESKWKPSVIIRVDGYSKHFSTESGRDALLNQFVENTDAGKPWVVPANQFDVQTVKPLTLADLALADFVKLDKRTVASILHVPPFVLGVGEFRRDEWNTFISSRIMELAQVIEQELTRKLIVRDDEFFRFNPRSLYNYELKDLSAIADDQYIRGIMTGNEVRGWLGMPPLDGLDELVLLENYIPRGMIADQSKLQGGGQDA